MDDDRLRRRRDELGDPPERREAVHGGGEPVSGGVEDHFGATGELRLHRLPERASLVESDRANPLRAQALHLRRAPDSDHGGRPSGAREPDRRLADGAAAEDEERRARLDLGPLERVPRRGVGDTTRGRLLEG